MGNYASKLFHAYESQKESDEIQTDKHQVAIENNKMCTPILSEKKVLNDPRSVSVGIPRTPIEVKYIPVETTKRKPSAIPKYLQKKQYLETDMDVVMPPLTPKKHFVSKLNNSELSESDEMQKYLTPDINARKNAKVITPIDRERYKILGLDPRSPAADFDRTPILLPKSLALIKARSQENLSRRGSYEMDMYKPEISLSLSSTEIQLLPDMASEGLEILDMEKQNKSFSISQSDSDSSVYESEKEVTVIKNPKCKNGKEVSLLSDEQTVVTHKEKDKGNTDKQDNYKDIEHNMKTMHINNDDKIKVWHDLSSSKENVSGKEEKENIVQIFPGEKTQREDIIITFDEYTTISTSLPKPLKTEEDYCKKGDIGGRKKKSTKTDAKLTLNEKKIFISENKYGTEIPMNRTPLGNRSNGPLQNMSTKSPQQLSKNNAASIKMQQENTPPYKTYSAKARNEIQWDPNSTVFI